MEIRDYYPKRYIEDRIERKYGETNPNFSAEDGYKNFYEDDDYPDLVYWETDNPIAHSRLAEGLKKEMVLLRAEKSLEEMPGVKSKIEVSEDGEEKEVFISRNPENKKIKIKIKAFSRVDAIKEYEGLRPVR